MNGELDKKLLEAVRRGNAYKVIEFLREGANVNTRDEDGLTPLHNAAANGHLDVVKLLLEKGADPAIRSNGGWTPLDIARALGHAEVVKVLETFWRSTPSIVSVECSGLRAGEWGRLLVRVRGLGTASLSLEGDVEWLDPGRVKLSGDAVVEVPVRPRAASGVPVRVVVKSPSGEDAKITWLKVSDRAGKCPSCGAPVEPGAKYCWRCGAKLK
jgi:hypothetical protein